ncbi:hypothetical protein [Microbacterium sp. p3-SID336]|uniref:hypothetical protein n=1 Tax=Microbacterium sp. p3-SID336 TaxID=2916212 RepID=UPI0021A2B397|nr:hypothetical protein [Microbacterium sp. p3-SID336]MCT1477863.1 hypothetical protein [Microbacterium sp. p3-SID336]
MLRAISVGVKRAEDVARFLNVPDRLVDAIIADLLFDRYLTVDATGDEAVLQLSPTGKTLVSTLVQERVVERTVAYLVDGLSGEPVSVKRDLVLTADDLDDDPRLVLNPDSDVDIDIGPDDTARFLGVDPVRPERESTLLSVLGVESTTKQYLAATALLFESETDPQDRYLRVCVDGRQDERIETLAREHGLLDSMRLTQRIDEDRRRVDRLLPEEILEARTPDVLIEDALEELRRLTPIAAENRNETALDARRSKIRTQLAAAPVRRLSVMEAAEYSEVSLLAAEQGVLISASRLWPTNRAEHFVAVMRQLLQAGSPITLETPPRQQLSKTDVATLDRLSREFPDGGIEFSDTKPAHEASFIVIDQTSMTVFPGGPFAELATLSDRFGDDRPTVVRGSERVQAVIAAAHGAAPTMRGRTAELSRRTRRQN